MSSSRPVSVSRVGTIHLRRFASLGGAEAHAVFSAHENLFAKSMKLTHWITVSQQVLAAPTTSTSPEQAHNSVLDSSLHQINQPFSPACFLTTATHISQSRPYRERANPGYIIRLSARNCVKRSQSFNLGSYISRSLVRWQISHDMAHDIRGICWLKSAKNPSDLIQTLSRPYFR